MEKIMRFDGNLDMFKNIVLVYKDKDGNVFIGSSYNDENGSENHKNSIILYKEPLPKNMDYLMGWNYLDDNSDKLYLVFNEHSEVAVDDFLASHNIDKTWKDIDYIVLDDYMELNDRLDRDELKNNEVRAYVTLY